MKVELLEYSPLLNCSTGIRMCWNSEQHSDTVTWMEAETEIGTKDKALIDRIANKNKHSSVLRHLSYTFRIECSTKTLLAFTRHKAGIDFSVQSTRYTTKKRKDKLSYTKTENEAVNKLLEQSMALVQEAIKSGASNDDLAMLLPQAYDYTFQVTMNAQAIQHFLTLRTTSDAHWDIRNVANEIFSKLPEEHKYLYSHCISGSDEWKAYRIEEAEKLLKGTK